jgi:hypothetical protein
MALPERLSEGLDIAAPDCQDPEVRRRLCGPAMRTFLNICAAWNLSVNQQRGPLDWPAASTYHMYKSGQIGTLSFDTLSRISLVLGI